MIYKYKNRDDRWKRAAGLALSALNIYKHNPQHSSVNVNERRCWTGWVLQLGHKKTLQNLHCKCGCYYYCYYLVISLIETVLIG